MSVVVGCGGAAAAAAARARRARTGRIRGNNDEGKV
jgi:hypothetical protein